MPTESLIAVYLFSFVVTFGAVVSPGPVTAAILSESPRQGWRVGPLMASGHSALELIMVVLITLGLAAGMASPVIRTVIAGLGGVTLIAIGGSYLLGVARGKMRLPDREQLTTPRSYWALVALGIATTLSNPFWYVWWVTVAAGYLAQAQALGFATVAAFYTGHISADYAWDSFLAASGSAGARVLTNQRYRAVIVLTAGFMIYFGVSFILTAVS